MNRRSILRVVGATALLKFSSATGSAASGSSLISVLTPTARYEGDVVTEEGNVARFRGIRYGHAPRERRFQSALPVAPSSQVIRALDWQAACPQPARPDAGGEEDCLMLNLWAPLKAIQTQQPVPVMVYFHGGAYSSGSATDPEHDGSHLAAQEQVIVVTVNHRINVLGYLYLDPLYPELSGSGNVGQTDLILALEWIKKNIEAFGGDSQCVTVFGQSGGGAKIATLMAMPAAKGLFHRAITMSGQQITASGPDHAERRTRAFLKSLGEDPLHAEVPRLMHALRSTRDPILGGSLYMGPVLDMHHLHRHPFWPNAPEQSADIPLMLGNTISETRAFYHPHGPVMQGLSFENLAERIRPEIKVDLHTAWVVEQYRKRFPQDTATRLFHRIVTASRSWRGQVIEAEARASAGQPVFVYQLNFRDAKHTDDIVLAFGTHQSSDPEVNEVSKRLMSRFATFARSGKAGWPEYTLASRQTLIIDSQDSVLADPRHWERELFARVPYTQPGT
ncbi:MAG: hypothetical protein RLY30_477 [Pseudomonadota bacterium]